MAARISHHEFTCRTPGAARYSRDRSGGNFRALQRPWWTKRKQGRHRGDASTPAKRNRRHGTGFALAGAKPQAGARTSARRNRRSTAYGAAGTCCRARKGTAPQITSPRSIKAAHFGIKTKAQRAQEAARTCERLASAAAKGPFRTRRGCPHHPENIPVGTLPATRENAMGKRADSVIGLDL